MIKKGQVSPNRVLVHRHIITERFGYISEVGGWRFLSVLDRVGFCA